MTADTYTPAGADLESADDTPGRVPPQDLDAERSVLGAMLLSRAALSDCQEVLAGSDFYRPQHEVIFDAIRGLDEHGQKVDPITVADELRRQGALTRIGGAPYLHTLVRDLPTAANAGYYAAIVAKTATRRHLIEAGTRIVQLGYATDGSDIADLVETARAEVDATTRSTPSGPTVLDDEIDETIDLLERGDLPAVATPWDDLNYVIGGWRPSRLYVVGARPGVGKSILLLQAALDLSQQGLVAFHSLEMSKTEVHERILAQMAGVSLTRMDKHQLTDHDWQRIADARQRIPNHRIFIDDRAEIRTVDIRAHARTLARHGDLAGVLVDYLQLMEPPRGDRRNRQEQVSTFSRQLKLLAKELQVPVIVASQLNRNPESRSDKRPQMSDLRESGAVEQDSDVILLMHVDEENAPDQAEVAVPKNRQGPKGHAVLTRRGEFARLDSQEWHPGPPRPAARDLTEPVHGHDEDDR